VQEVFEIKLIADPDGTETVILARSLDRGEKEKAIHQRFLDRMETALRKLRAFVESGRLNDMSSDPDGLCPAREVAAGNRAGD
jgi:hypothetical protein